MNIGELFISLGVKGADKTVNSLSDVKKGMGEIGSSSLAAKAAILGAMYALERLLSSSAQAGTNLENFTALTGISTQTLQEYQYAARQVGISNEEMSGSIKSVQNVMTAMRLGKGAPEGMAMLTGKVGFDANKAKSDTSYVMKKLQEYANKEQEVGMRNFVLKSFGLSETVIAGMARNAFRPEVMAKAPTYSPNEIKNLDRANAAWSNLGNHIQMAIGHFNAAHGGKLVTDISKIVDGVIKLIGALITLSEKLHVFDALGKVFGIAAQGVDLLGTHVAAITSGKKGAIEKIVGKDIKLLAGGAEMVGNLGKSFAQHLFPSSKIATSGKSESSIVKMAPIPSPVTPAAVAPPVSNSVQRNSTQNNNVNQTFHFTTDGSNHKQVGDAAQKGITRAFFQIPQGGY